MSQQSTMGKRNFILKSYLELSGKDRKEGRKKRATRIATDYEEEISLEKKNFFSRSFGFIGKKLNFTIFLSLFTPFFKNQITNT